ncbi:hypothetical protein P875_00021863 [Aspergillus parasiticus SU-1]|uniref:Uncharacterized protein n=1 Tax=Aspergillus parasiticus (strain ATCC 56775 / NRRL 5862 / SRRC 143 / SU-1) TaxID=1403190 RepID=A0A0F0IE37_ASPPU|nr:hypothetical protein P875_00021863 [Aspergillus parasiticus SU-1]
MDESLAAYLGWTDRDRLPGTPAITLELQGSERLWRRTPYLFEVTLRRIDEDARPCLFAWTPHIQGFTVSGLILLHHTPEGLKKVELPISALPPLEPWVNKQSSLIEHAPGGAQRWVDIFPDNYVSLLKSGERYTLLWPGERYATWEWGVAKDHLFDYIPTQNVSLVLPGRPTLTFTVEEGEQPSPISKMLPMDISAHTEGAPILIAKVACAPTAPLKKREVTTTVYVTYHYEPSGQSRPITLQIQNLLFPNVYEWRGIWEDCSPDLHGYGIWDDPDIQISPGQDKNFACLYPGETWSFTGNYELSEEVQVGSSLRCQLGETKINWWDWGTRDDHLSTKITVPCWMGPEIIEPSDNDGRPLLIVPASNPVDVQLM